MPARRRRPPVKAAERNRHGAEGAVYRRIAAFVVARDRGVCHVCGHSGAKVPDHLAPVAERPDLALDAANMKAAHGYLKSGGGECETCSAAAAVHGRGPVYCNEIRGALSVERARRIIEARTGLTLVNGSQPQGERDWLARRFRPGRRRRDRSRLMRLVRHQALQPVDLLWQCLLFRHPYLLNIPHEQVHVPNSMRISFTSSLPAAARAVAVPGDAVAGLAAAQRRPPHDQVHLTLLLRCPRSARGR